MLDIYAGKNALKIIQKHQRSNNRDSHGLDRRSLIN